MATVADHVINALHISGVRRVYGLPGDSLNGFTDALRRNGEITWEHVRHEETAAFAAAAARSTAAALFSDSWYSVSGTESATMPPPA